MTEATTQLTDDARYTALLARDPRFDGIFYVAVSTTGIYCRPICPVRPPGRARCTFYASPAQAEHAGYRACFRCRPELAPGHAAVAAVDAVDTLVATALRRIAEGALNERSIDELAGELGVSARHLRRGVESRLGVSPVELAQTHRLALAKQLLQDTQLPVTQIAFAAGFRSVRRFNALFAGKLGRAPSDVRRHAPPGTAHTARTTREVTARGATATAPGAITLRLDYRPPYDWARMLGFLAPRAVPGVEWMDGTTYRRIAHVDGAVGAIAVRPAAKRHALELELEPSLLPALMPLVARVRRMFDLDARPDQIDAALGKDKLLAPMIAARPGLRLPGAIDPFEAAIRAMLGQQVSVAAATTLAGRFAAQLGTPVAGAAAAAATADNAAAPPRYRFPTPAEVVAAGPGRIVKIGMPMTRANAIHTLAGAIARGDIALDRATELDAFVDRLVALPGIGPWTAHYLAMRALHVPDAFPAADLGIQKALHRAGPKAAAARAEAWRPYRSYAVIQLWTQLSEGGLP